MTFDSLHFKAPKMVVEPPGPKAKRIIKMQAETEGNAIYYPKVLPFVPQTGFGATIKDVDGNTYIDFSAGVSVLNFGHSNPHVLKSAMDQMRRLTHTLDFPTVARTDLVKRLEGIAPGSLRNNCKVVFGGPSGSDAIEASFKLAKFATKRHSVIAFSGAYHGQTTGALAATAEKKYREHYSPLGPEVHFAPYPNLYRNPFDSDNPRELGRLCAGYLEDMIENPDSGVMPPAAVIIEPIQGEGGINVPPEGFVKEVEKIAKRNGIVFIADEIQSGFGRTGKWFASEHSGASPDIITMAKSLGGVGLPIAGIMYKKELDVWTPAAHVGTFRGNVVAMAGGAAAIDFAKKFRLLDHVNRVGGRALKFLVGLKSESKYIGDVRGKGLFIGVEFVKDRDTKEPWKQICDSIQLACFKRGVIIWRGGGYGNVIRLLPPLTITEDLLTEGLGIFAEEVKNAEKRMGP